MSEILCMIVATPRDPHPTPTVGRMWLLSGLLNVLLAVFLHVESPAVEVSPHTWHHPSSADDFIKVQALELCHGHGLWSGYFHSRTHNVSLFFIFVRAVTDPETSPLAIWTNGGPGTSSLGVAFSSATGCILTEDYNGRKLVYRPSAEQWNTKLNVIFVDQPIGTGFSFGSGESAYDSRIGAEIIYDFIQVVLSRHTRIPSVSLHSLSYGGHFIPEWAVKILSANAAPGNNRLIPLDKISLGNAWFGNDEQYLSLFDTLCVKEPYFGGPSAALLPETQCAAVLVHRDSCAEMLVACRADPRTTHCAAVHLWCWTAALHHFALTGRNMLHLSTFSPTVDAFLEYPSLTRYLNLPQVQRMLGVIDNGGIRQWEYYNRSVSVLHKLAGDDIRRTDVLLPELVKAGVDVLLYVGTLDFSCGYRAARRMITSLELIEIPLELGDWEHGPGRYVCSSKNSGDGKFCYLEIDGAGHGVAYEYPTWGTVLQKWILQGSV
jgi:cathepsin A (carboxypeptidase C)